ncbi:pyrimidine 5'-nucleotidase [Parvibaculaceae bacterium PLY_AMNH_Bact1]|nr:pyrimidine 5'-nucleotidase [Parvibaculaceae bacterium PLY_AMNH_Bact1]
MSDEPEQSLKNPDFLHIETWVFDLDNTLYPPECDLFSQVDVRMRDFISDYLNVDPEEARRLQKHYYVEHGTTLSGLMKVHDLAPKAFLDYVHQIDVSHIAPANDLNRAIERLPGRKVIFTNGTVAHAENVTEQLGITHHFDEVYDIVAVDYTPKPAPQAYARFVSGTGIDPTRSAMFEDIARNLLAPHDMGMTTVWVRPGEPGPEKHQQMSHEGADGDHVHHVTDDLTEFLQSL